MSETRPLHVMYVHDFGEPAGGAEESLKLLIRGMEGVNAATTAAVPHGSLSAELQREGAGIEFIPLTTPTLKAGFRESVRSSASVLLSQLAILRAVVKHRPSLIHANSIFSALTALPAAKLFRRPLVCHVRIFSHPGIASRLATKALALCGTQFVAISTAIRSHLETNLGVPGGRVLIVPNAVDLDAFQPFDTDRRAVWGLDEKRPVIGFVGQLSKHKGIDTFLNAVSLVTERLPECQVVIVGDVVKWPGPYSMTTEEIRELTDRLQLTDKILHVGRESDMPAAYNAFDILLVPSLFEPFGRVVIEAMACGIPVIASDVPGMNELFQHGEAGYFSPSTSAETFAERTVEILSNPDLRRRMSKSAEIEARNRYSLDHQTELIQAVYRRFSQKPVAGNGLSSS